MQSWWLPRAIHADTEHLAAPRLGCSVATEKDVQPMTVDGAASINYRDCLAIVIAWNAHARTEGEHIRIGRDKSAPIVTDGFATGGNTVGSESTANLARAVSGDFHPNGLGW